ncbi:GldL-related protein [Flavobacterium sp. RSB2_4_14]|uniref:GldL-related protein n=1 Tax=Flavobacterium sp. RSB2_4_14 TaxID=3447665 RepID=UPI003F3B0A11
MDAKKIITLSFVLAILIVIFGSLLKIMHWPYATEVMTIGLLSQLVFIILSLTEISKSDKIDGTEKFMWFIGFIFIGTITGLVYILSARKRIITN